MSGQSTPQTPDAQAATTGGNSITGNVINARDDYADRFPRTLVAARVSRDMLERIVFRNNAYHHKRGNYASLGTGSRLPFDQWIELTGEEGAADRRVQYPDPYITPHAAIGFDSFDELLAAAEAGDVTAEQINAAVREKGFGIEDD